MGAYGDPAVTVDVEQPGVPAGFLRLRVLSSSNPAVARWATYGSGGPPRATAA